MALSTPTDVRRRLLARRDGERTVAADQAPTAHSATHTSPGLQFEAFYQAHYPSVVRLAYSLCGSRGVAEELAQEAFVSAHARWRRVVGFDRPDLWVRRVVINRSISYRRREAIERKAVARIRLDRDEIGEPVVSDELVWQALRELSPRQAEVLALFYVEDQPMSAVAEILGLGPETVKTHLKRGRAALAVKLDEMGHVR
jgi:RNA polymerase sigma-70 factor (ECF subfamily)